MDARKDSNIDPKIGVASISKKSHKESKTECVAMKYSNNSKGPLHEAVIVSGVHFFLKLSANNEAVCINWIKEGNRIIQPPNIGEYAYDAYEFATINEVKTYIERAKKESIGSLYAKAKCIVCKYNDQDSYKLIVLAAEIVWSYFQDLYSTTHYLAVIGDNGSGKSTVGDTFESVGYRVVNMTDPSAANLFRILGTIEPGQCTLIAEEAEKIDQSQEIMSTLKTGYQFKSRIARINMKTGKQEFYYTYCFKMIIAERSPNETRAKGVLDRTFVLTTYNGRPTYDIKEILKPGGDPKRQLLLEEMNDFRKLMLIYRLIHFKDVINDLDIGIYGRQKELCKPVLQLFHNSEHLTEIQLAFQIFLNAKNNRKSSSIEAVLHPIIVDLVSRMGKEVYAGQIWTSILETIPGAFDNKKPNEFQSYDYGTLYRNTITNIVCDKFGAERRHRKTGTLLTFDIEKLVRVGRLYNLDTKIQTKIYADSEGGDTDEHISTDTPFSTTQSSGNGEGGDTGEGSKENSIVVTVTQGKKDVERNRINISSEAQRSSNTITNSIKSNNLVDCFWPNSQQRYSTEPSQPSQPSLSTDTNSNMDKNQNAGVDMRNKLYRLYNTDVFVCHNCKNRGDIWYMQKHVCRN